MRAGGGGGLRESKKSGTFQPFECERGGNDPREEKKHDEHLIYCAGDRPARDG